MPVSGIEPLTYWLRISCSTPELHRHQKEFSFWFIGSILPSKLTLNLDPKLREKLLKESRNPFRGIRRLTWALLMTSAGLGLLIMVIRLFSGDHVLRTDLGIQIIAFLVFVTLTVFDRSKADWKILKRALDRNDLSFVVLNWNWLQNIYETYYENCLCC